LVKYLIIFLLFVLSFGYQANAGPYDNVGAITPFNLANSLDLADYCDGGDANPDDSCMSTWIAAAKAQGKHLYASAGTYIYTTIQSNLFSNFHMKCASNTAVTFKGSANTFFIWSPSFITPGQPWSDISIEDCGFDMQDSISNFGSVITINPTVSGTKNITIRGNRVFDSTQPGSMYVEDTRQRQYIVILFSDDVLIENNNLSEGGRIKAGRPGNRIVIRNNTLFNINDNAITVVNFPLSGQISSHHLIEGNTVTNPLGSGVFFGADGESSGTTIMVTTDVTIRNNLIVGNFDFGIIGTLPNRTARINIYGNIIIKNNAPFSLGGLFNSGIALGRADNSVLPTQDITIRNNVVRTEGGAKLELGGLFIKTNHNNICCLCNTFTIGPSPTYAIFLQRTTSGTLKLTGNELNGSVVRDDGTMVIDQSGSTNGCFVPTD